MTKQKVKKAAAYRLGRFEQKKGVYIGIWEPKDEDNHKSLGKLFDVFAAPFDLQKKGNSKVVSNRKVFTAVASMPSLLSHRGFDHSKGSHSPESNLIQSLVEGRYGGEWFLPNGELHAELLHRLRSVGDLRGTFRTKPKCDNSHWYLSCTRYWENESISWAQNYGHEHEDNTFPSRWFSGREKLKGSVRLVRAEVRSEAGPVPAV